MSPVCGHAAVGLPRIVSTLRPMKFAKGTPSRWRRSSRRRSRPWWNSARRDTIGAFSQVPASSAFSFWSPMWSPCAWLRRTTSIGPSRGSSRAHHRLAGVVEDANAGGVLEDRRAVARAQLAGVRAERRDLHRLRAGGRAGCSRQHKNQMDDGVSHDLLTAMTSYQVCQIAARGRRRIIRPCKAKENVV